VEVEVSHVFPRVDVVVSAAEVSIAVAARPPKTWSLGETFSSQGAGTALHLRTRRVSPAHRVAGIAGTTEVTGVSEDSAGDWRYTTWSGISPGDPDFLFDFADKLDVLLTMAPDGWHPSAGQAAILTEAVAEATMCAGVRAALPVTFVRSPSAGFSAAQLRRPVDGDDPTLARGATLRLTVGLDRADEGARVTLLQSLTDYAGRRGFGLRVADRRYGTISGKWIVLQRIDPRVLERTTAEANERAAPLGWEPDSGDTALLTVIGPSRQGSFAAVAAALATAGIQIRAVTCLSLQDLAFVHAEVIVPGGDGPSTELRSLLSRQGSRPSTLVDLVRDLAPDAPVLGDALRLRPARGHQCLLSGPFRAAGGGSALSPVWASWEVRDAGTDVGDTGTAQALVARFRAHPRVTTCRLEYQRFRRRSGDQIAERVKLGVALRERDDPAATGAESSDDPMAEVCLAIQQALRVPGAWGPPPGTDPRARPPRLVSFRVAPRERWLGTWLDDPS